MNIWKQIKTERFTINQIGRIEMEIIHTLHELDCYNSVNIYKSDSLFLLSFSSFSILEEFEKILSGKIKLHGKISINLENCSEPNIKGLDKLEFLD